MWRWLPPGDKHGVEPVGRIVVTIPNDLLGSRPTCDKGDHFGESSGDALDRAATGSAGTPVHELCAVGAITGDADALALVYSRVASCSSWRRRSASSINSRISSFSLVVSDTGCMRRGGTLGPACRSKPSAPAPAAASPPPPGRPGTSG